LKNIYFNLLLLAQITACSQISPQEYSHLVFEQGMNYEIGCSLINSPLNSRFTVRQNIVAGNAHYISRSSKTSCIIEFTVGENTNPPLVCGSLLPSEAEKRDYANGKFRSIKPFWNGEINGVILNWGYISNPSDCMADFSGH
jgi:hypothetical protein